MTESKIINIACPKCDAAPGIPCAQIGHLTAYGIVNLVDGPHFHMERWDAAEETLAYREIDKPRKIK